MVVDPTDAKRGIDRVDSGLQKLLALAAQFFALRKLVGLADTFQNLENRLRTVTNSEAELAKRTKELLDIANRTRASFEGTVTIYSRVALAAQQLGIEQARVLVFTEQLNKAIALSGASAQESEAALIQLSQGIASGALRGDELRSVLEQLPVVADVIAKRMGVTRGELRELGQQGKITSEIIISAFEEARGELDAKFGKSVPTIGQAMILLKNKSLETVGALTGAGGFGAALVDLIGLATTLIGAVGKLGSAVSSLHPIFQDFGAIAAASILALAPLAAAAAPFTAVALAIGGITIALGRLNSELDKFNQALRDQEVGALSAYGLLGDRIRNTEAALRRMEDAFEENGPSPVVLARIEDLRAKLASLRGEQDKMRESAQKTRKVTEDGTSAVLAQLDREIALLKLSNTEREIANVLAKEEARLKAAGFAVSDEQRAELETRLRTIDSLKAQNDVLEGLFGPMDEYARKVDAARALLDAGRISLDEYNRALSGSSEFGPPTAPAEDDPSGAFPDSSLLPSTESGPLQGPPQDALQRASAALADQNRLLALNNSEREIQARLIAIVNQLQSEGRAVDEAEIASLEDQLRLGQDITAAQEEQARARRLALESERELLDALRGPQERYNDLFEASNRLYRDGVISSKEYQRSLLELTVAAKSTSVELGDGFSRGIAKVQLQIMDLAAISDNMLVGGFNRAEDALVAFVQTGKLEFGGLIDSLLADLTRLAIQQALLGLLTSLFNPVGSLAGGLFGGGGGGGILGFAEGGNVNSNEDILVGERGPEIFRPGVAGRVIPNDEINRGSSRAAPNAPAAAPLNLRIINQLDPDLLFSALSGPEGEKVIMNVIRKNRTVIGKGLA